MRRDAAAIVAAMCLTSATVVAQTTTFTINSVSANVYKSPSTGSPVIGKVSRGTVLEVTRELGSWVRIVWTGTPDGIGYVHVNMGSIGHGTTTSSAATARAGSRDASQPTPAATPRGRTGRDDVRSAPPPPERDARPAPPSRAGERLSATGGEYVMPPTHVLGLGGLISGSWNGGGAVARVWSRSRLGVQIEVARYTVSGTAAAGRVSSVEIAPSLLYSLKDHVTDRAWLRPYVGGGAGLHRQTLSGVTPGVADSTSDNSVGARIFGGTELTFPGAPRLAIGADLGYRWSATPFAGFDPGGLEVTLSGHWYVK